MAVQGFVEADYLAAKLAALQADSATAADWAGKDTAFLTKVLDSFGFTPESHYEQFGYKEGLAPNNLFDAAQYKLAKATALFNEGGYMTVAAAQAAFEAAWTGDVYQHYLAFGSAEGINPSNAFDESSYYDTKLAALQADPATATEWAGKTAADVKAALAAAGFTALTHYEAFGQYETGVTATAVPDGEKVNTGGVAVPGSTFALTTGVDTLTGTSGDDTFVADNTGTNATSSVADTVNGGDGTDALSIYSKGTASAIPQMTSIETVNLYDQNVAFDISSVSGVETVNIHRGEGDDTITVGAGVAVGLVDVVVGTGGDNAAQTIAYKATDTSATLNLNNVTAKGTDVNEDVAITGAALTSLTVNASGTKSTFDALDVAAVKTVTLNAAVDFTAPIETTATGGTLTVTGAGKVNLGALDDGFTTVTAATATGSLTAAIGTAADMVLTGSKGNDVITANTTDAIATTAKLAVDAGDGTDVLVITETADVDTAADAARYTNFETIRSADSVDMSLVSGITALQITGGTAESYTKMTAVQAGNITFTGNNTTSTTFALANSAGTSDAISINLASTTATTNVDVIGIAVAGIETVNISATTGTNGTESDFGFLANSADNVSKINITGSADVKLNQVANTFDTVAVAIDASGLTGTADFELSGGVLFAGSSVKGSANDDTIALSTTTGTTYTTGAGKDSLTGTAATLVATGSDDNMINAGDDIDTLTVTDAADVTLTDNHFTNVSNVENLVISAAADTSITSGAAFNTAFANGVTITQAGHATADKSAVYALGLSNVNTTVTLTSTTNGDATGEDLSVTTGSGNDTVTISDTSFVGKTGADAAQIIANTGSGNDTITVSYGTLVSDNTSTSVLVDAGTGKDILSMTGTNADNALGITEFKVQDGDSLAASYDEITGFNLAEGDKFADTLDFDAATVVANATVDGTDSGTIKSHKVASGMITFDDVDSFAAAVTVNSTNLSDVLTYLAANITTAGETVAFAYDANGDGTNDATFVFNQGTNDSVVELVGVVATSMSATNAHTAGMIDIA